MSVVTLSFRAMLTGVIAAVVFASPPGWGADAPDCIRGVVLRTQALPAGAGEAPMTRALLSTDEGLCAVRLPGPNEDWVGFADATVEIFGTLSGSEFVVDSKSAVHILKYPPLSPTVVHDVLPAGEIVYRRRVEAEIAAHRRQLNFAWLSVGLIALAVAVLVWAFVSSARKRPLCAPDARAVSEPRTAECLHDRIRLRGGRHDPNAAAVGRLSRTVRLTTSWLLPLTGM